MHLAPHHFQAQSRYFEDLQHFATRALFSYPWGVLGLSLDHDAIKNGTVAILDARGILPDGLPFRIPGDSAPEPIDLADRFSPTASSQKVYLEIPAYRSSGANCAMNGASRGDQLRFHSAPEPIQDNVTGDHEQVVPLAGKNLRLVLDSDLPSDDDESQMGSTSAPTRIPLARVRRDGSGRFEYDATFMPPTLQLGGSRALTSLLTRIIEVLEERSRSLANERRGLRGGPDTSELVGFWFTHALNAHLPVLRHHAEARAVHPSRVFADLSALAGALATFSLSGDAASLPLYDHTDPGPGFRGLEEAIRRGLETVLASGVLYLPITMGEGYFHAATVTDPRALESDRHWYLGVRSGGPRSAVLEGVPRLAKLCSAKHIERLVREAYPGLGLDHVPSPPKGLVPTPGTEYFRVRRTEPCWRSIVDTGEVGIYLPESIVEPELEIVILQDPERS